jgi:hypothetical protein
MPNKQRISLRAKELESRALQAGALRAGVLRAGVLREPALRVRTRLLTNRKEAGFHRPLVRGH